MADAPLFKRFVEPGRLVLVRYGPLEGKIATIVDMVSINKVLIDGPTTGVKRQMIPLKWVSLTGFKSNLGRGAKEKALKKALKESDTVSNWEKSAWAKKIAAKKAKAALTDLDRFKLMLAKKKVNQEVKKSLKPKKK
ncbi:unnamed protein product [Amoebophrya sp. A120]|nr:unnamed protein product [Amoebophrya sp. A120]|eukprot:GSA120T00019029001.1